MLPNALFDLRNFKIEDLMGDILESELFEDKDIIEVVGYKYEEQNKIMTEQLNHVVQVYKYYNVPSVYINSLKYPQ